MKRFLAFMLGIVFGVVFLLGTFGFALYTSVTVVHPNEIYTDIENYLGDLGDVSLLQAYYNILDLYKNKTGNLTDEKLYSVGDFLADNHISSTNDDGQTMAFGIVMPKELLDAPLFEYFNTNVDENGHTGVQRALKQIKLSSVPSIVNTFATPGEDGQPIVSEQVVTELDKHSVYDLVYGENQTADGLPNIVANLSVVFENITLADMIPIFRPGEDGTDNIIKNLLFAVGQAPIGKLITELTGDDNILGILGEDGSLSAVGKLTIADILGSGDPLISSLLGAISISDFITDQGEFTIMKAMDSISIAGLVGLVNRTVDVQIDQENITAYYQVNDDASQGPLIWSVGSLDGNYYISLNAQNDAVATTWYQAQLVCNQAHDHQADCFDYVWYTPCKTEHDHDGEYTISVGETVTAYQVVSVDSLFHTLAGLKLSCLFDDTGAINFDNLIAQFDDHSIDTIIRDLLAENEILNKLSALLKLDSMTLSDLLAEGGIDTLLSKVTDTPIVEILETFEVTGMDFIVDIVGDMSINQLIEGGFTDISIGGLLGLVKREMDITDTDGELLAGIVTHDFTKTVEENVIVELSVAKQVVGEDEIYYLSTNYDKDADKLAENYVEATWYQARLDCVDDAHTTLDSHEKGCFEYILYQVCTNEETDHNHQVEDAFSIVTPDEEGIDIINYYVETNKLYAVLGNMTIGSIIEGGFNSLFDELLDLKLCELFDILGVGPMEGALEALSKFSIKELMEGGYNELTLGSLLGYIRYENPGVVASGSTITFKDDDENVVGYVAKVDEQTVLSNDGDTWYNGKLACEDDHGHTFECYEYLWYGKCQDGCVDDHEHTTIDGANHTVASGIFGILVDLTIGDITNNPNSLLDKVFEIKLSELLGDDAEGLMATLGKYSIKDLMDPSTLNGIGIGDILSYVRNDITSDITPANGWDVDVIVDGTTTIVKQNSTTNKYSYYDVDDEKWYAGQLSCKKQVHAHSEPDCGTAGSWDCSTDEHSHYADCYGYIWYEKCTTAGCTEHSEHCEIDGTAYGSIAGLYGVLADLTIGDLTEGADIMDIITNRLTLGDIFGDNIPEMLASLKDTPISELSGAIETTQVGDLLGFEYDTTENRWENDGTPLSGIEKVLADKTINDLKDFSTILNEVTLGDVLDPVPEMLEALANTKIPDLASELENLEVGKLLGYEYNEIQSRWEKDGAPLEGVEKIIAGKKISDLKNFNTILDEVTLGDVLGDDIPSMLGKLKDTPVTKIGEEIDKLVVGDFLGYGHLSVDVETSGWTEVAGIDGLYQHSDGRFAKAHEEIYYVAELTCSDEHAQHTATCYNYKWYTKCQSGCDGTTHSNTHYADTNGNYFVEVVGITAKLAGKTINQLSNLSDLMNDLTLNDVFGEGKVPSMLESIADQNIANLETALNKIYVGEFLGYEKGEVLLDENKCTDPSHEHNTDLADTNCCYQVKLACDDKSHEHSAGCYIECHKWYTLACDINHAHSMPTCYSQVTGLMGKIANERLDTLSDMGETIKTFTLRDVMGDSIPGMLKGIADTPIGELDSALDNLYLGEILQYQKHPAEQSTIDDCTVTVVDGFVKTNVSNTVYIMYVDDVWYESVLSCTTANCTHTTIDCYGYLWYDGATVATGITAKLANERVSELGDLGDTIQTFSLYDVLGDNVPSMLDGIKNEPISNLNSSINNIYVGDFLGYEQGERKLVCAETDSTHIHNENLADANCCYEKILGCGDTVDDHSATCYYYCYLWTQGEKQVDGMMLKIANKKVGNLGTIGDDISSFTFAEIMGKHDSDNAIIKELYDTPVGDIGSKMDTMMLGTAMGYYRKADCGETHTHTESCYQVVDGKVVWYTDSACTTPVTAPQSAFVNSTLDGIGDDIDNIKLGELISIDNNSSAMLKALSDTPINGIATAINSMALGTSMGFVRRKITDTSAYVTAIFDNVKTDGANFVRLHDGTWYESTFSCQKEVHTHTEPDCGTAGNWTCKTEAHTHNCDCYGYVWYEECKLAEHTHEPTCGTAGNWICETEAHSHTTDIAIDGVNYKKVGGLNAKMSNLTVGNMGGQAVIDIVTGLSMRDMMDSGILTFAEEEQYKLAILFGCPDCKFTANTLLGAKEFSCDIKSYFEYTITAGSITAKDFFLKAHQNFTGDLTEHRDQWQDCTLTDFIKIMLGNM